MLRSLTLTFSSIYTRAVVWNYSVCFLIEFLSQSIFSNNHTEFKYLDDIAIMLCHYHILAICVFHNKISEEKAEHYYNSINQVKSKPSSHSFSKKLNLSWDYFNENGLVDILKLTHCVK